MVEDNRRSFYYENTKAVHVCVPRAIIRGDDTHTHTPSRRLSRLVAVVSKSRTFWTSTV